MSLLRFVSVDESNVAIYDAWYTDEELRHRYEPPTDAWLTYVMETPTVYAWLIYEDERAVGHVQMDIEHRTPSGSVGHVGLVVNPTLRRRGYGKRILRSLLQRAELVDLSHLQGTAEVDNIGSQRCMDAVGFIRQSTTPDADGFYTYTYPL
ncbi:MAG: GNAT family N-acetyltransferase [Chloroflexota bacterium]